MGAGWLTAGCPGGRLGDESGAISCLKLRSVSESEWLAPAHGGPGPRARNLGLVHRRVWGAVADGIAIGDYPVAVSLLELIIQLHGSGTVLETEIDLRLGVIAVDGYGVYDGVEGLGVQIAIARYAGLITVRIWASASLAGSAAFLLQPVRASNRNAAASMAVRSFISRLF